MSDIAPPGYEEEEILPPGSELVAEQAHSVPQSASLPSPMEPLAQQKRKPEQLDRRSKSPRGSGRGKGVGTLHVADKAHVGHDGPQGYAGYDPAAAGYDYTAYYSQYGYQQPQYSYQEYYGGYEGYYDPASYQAYANGSQDATQGLQPSLVDPALAAEIQADEAPPGEETAEPAAPGDEEPSPPSDDIMPPAEGLGSGPEGTEEIVPMSLAEEEERKRAEEERLRKEAATQAAADEAERQAVEHLRISHEAMSRAQEFEARRQEAQQTEPAYTGPSPEIVARIQKELKEAQEAAARKEREQHEAAAAAARLSEATKKQEAASALLKQKQNQLLKGSRMALGVKQKPEVASQRRAVDKVFAQAQKEVARAESTHHVGPEKPKERPKSGPTKLYMPEPLAKSNIPPTEARRTAVARASRSRSRTPSYSRSPSPGARPPGARQPVRKRGRSRSSSYSSQGRSRTPHRIRSRSYQRHARGRGRRGMRAFSDSQSPDRSLSRSRSRSFHRSPSRGRGRSRSYSPVRTRRSIPPKRVADFRPRSQSPPPKGRFTRDGNRQYRATAEPVRAALRASMTQQPVRTTQEVRAPERYEPPPEPLFPIPASSIPNAEPARLLKSTATAATQQPESPKKERRKRKHKSHKEAEKPAEPPTQPEETEKRTKKQKLVQVHYDEADPLEPAAGIDRIQNQRLKAPPAPTSTSLSIPGRKAEALPSTAPPSRGFEREFAPEEFGLRLPPSLAELRKKYSREKGSTASAQAVVPKPEQITAPTTRPVANSTVENSKAKDTPAEDTAARQVKDLQKKSAEAVMNKNVSDSARLPAPASQIAVPVSKPAAAEIPSSRPLGLKNAPHGVARTAVQPPAAKAEPQGKVASKEANKPTRPRQIRKRPSPSPPPQRFARRNVRAPSPRRRVIRRSRSYSSFSSGSRSRSRSRSYRRSYSRSRSRSYSRQRSSSRSLSVSRSRYRSASGSRSRSRSSSRSYSSRSVSPVRRRKLSPSLSPKKGQRLQSPVVPKRMRMDEVAPQAKPAPVNMVAATVPVVAATPPSIKKPTPASQIPAGQPSTQAVRLEPLEKPDEPKAAAPTRVLRLANMIARDDLLDDDEYADILDDINDEVERKYGKLTGVEVPRPAKTGKDPPGVGLVFLAFQEKSSAVSAQKALHGRKFGENKVDSTFFDEGLYVKKMLA